MGQRAVASRRVIVPLELEQLFRLVQGRASTTVIGYMHKKVGKNKWHLRLCYIINDQLFVAKLKAVGLHGEHYSVDSYSISSAFRLRYSIRNETLVGEHLMQYNKAGNVQEHHIPPLSQVERKAVFNLELETFLHEVHLKLKASEAECNQWMKTIVNVREGRGPQQYPTVSNLARPVDLPAKVADYPKRRSAATPPYTAELEEEAEPSEYSNWSMAEQKNTTHSSCQNQQEQHHSSNVLSRIWSHHQPFPKINQLLHQKPKPVRVMQPPPTKSAMRTSPKNPGQTPQMTNTSRFTVEKTVKQKGRHEKQRPYHKQKGDESCAETHCNLSYSAGEETIDGEENRLKLLEKINHPQIPGRDNSLKGYHDCYEELHQRRKRRKQSKNRKGQWRSKAEGVNNQVQERLPPKTRKNEQSVVPFAAEGSDRNKTRGKITIIGQTPLLEKFWVMVKDGIKDSNQKVIQYHQQNKGHKPMPKRKAKLRTPNRIVEKDTMTEEL